MNYWPSRSTPKGFSIEKLAKSYRQKISGISIGKIDNNEADVSEGKDRDFQYNQHFSKDLKEIKRSQPYSHWANRDYNEYSKAA